jgi:hypothetical protein
MQGQDKLRVTAKSEDAASRAASVMTFLKVLEKMVATPA